MMATELLKDQAVSSWILCCILFVDKHGDDAAKKMALCAAKEYIALKDSFPDWPRIDLSDIWDDGENDHERSDNYGNQTNETDV